MTENRHPLIVDVAQVRLPADGFALYVRGRPDPAQAPGQLTVVGGHPQVGEPLDQAAHRKAFQMLPHRPSSKALNRPEQGGPL